MKELREKYIQGKGSLMLHKVGEIHVVCGLLKDFFRKLKEPLVTHKLHRNFMQAAGRSSGWIMAAGHGLKTPGKEWKYVCESVQTSSQALIVVLMSSLPMTKRRWEEPHDFVSVEFVHQ